MFSDSSLSNILWLIFAISSAISAAHIVVEKLLNYKLFPIFLALMPKVLKIFFPRTSVILWFENKTLQKNIYQAWDLAFIYLGILLSTLVLIAGFWVVLILKLVSVIEVPILLLVFWFLILLTNNIISTSNQVGLYFSLQKPKTNELNEIKRRMTENKDLAAKLGIAYFFRNWLFPIFTNFGLLILVILVIELYWPSWVIQSFQKTNKLNMNRNNIRTTYFAAYTGICAVVSILIKFVFK